MIMRSPSISSRAAGSSRPLVQIGPLAYDTMADRFTLEGRPLALTAQEQRILSFLTNRHGQLVSRADISEHVYARDLDPDSNTVDVLVGRIRRKLSPHGLIHTERGRGFRLQQASGDHAS